MAHELRIENGKASMFYVGEEPWHGLGTELHNPATAAEAIHAARLDWEVIKVPLYLSNGTQQVRDRFGVVQKNLYEKGACPVLGIVGKNYTPLQYGEAFAFFDPIVGENAAIYHTAGALGDGERVWILAKLPEDIHVVGDDVVRKFLLLSNSHEGGSSVQIKFTPVRVVCQNTLTMALSQGPTLRIAHTKDIHERLRGAVQLLGIIKDRFEKLDQTFGHMSRVKMDKERLKDYLRLVFPESIDLENDRSRDRALRDRFWAEYFFDQGKGNKEKGVSGTLWAAYNGVTEYIDHRLIQQDSGKRLDSVWFGEGYFAKARAFRVAEENIPEWSKV